MKLLHDFSDVCKAAFDIIEDCRASGIDPASEAAKDWHENNPESVYMQKLFRVYNDAKDNPPEGIIGVGAITYAEEKLIQYQLENPFNGNE